MRIEAAASVTFNHEGIVLVDGKPFFPIGVFTYEINPEVLAELHEVRCNTVLNGIALNQLDLLHQHGLMAVCPVNKDWITVAKNHPALLGWYLSDEPENRAVPVADLNKSYLQLKAADPSHPIGLCHTAFEALSKYASSCDFTMTDIYPITAQRDKNVMGVSLMMDEARRIHGRAWSQWTYIQAFGGPETDHGVWAVPLPHEVRFMVYQALVHRATGLLYFSYWPRQPRTWQAIASLNAEVQRLVPRLVSPGLEIAAQSSREEVQVRVRVSDRTFPLNPVVANPTKLRPNLFSKTKTPAKTVPHEKVESSGFMLAVNTSPRFIQSAIRAEPLEGELQLPFEGRNAVVRNHAIGERFAPYEAHIYMWGPEPQTSLGGE